MKETRYIRIWVSICAGLIAAFASIIIQTRFYNSKAGDLTWALIGARQWINGQDPYIILDSNNYPSDPTPLYYPFPSVLFVLPLSFMPDLIATGIWVGFTVGLMTFAITQGGFWRLPILASVPLWAAVAQVQWTPLLLSIWVWPDLLFLSLLKPTSGLALAAKHPTRKGIGILVVVVVLSIILLPNWPLSWLESIKQSRHLIPILYGPGPFLVLSLLAWRFPEARLLFILAVLPQRMYFYDQLPLLLVAKNLRQQLIIVLSSWIAFLMTVWLGPTWKWHAIWSPPVIDGPAGWIIVCLYGSALILVLIQWYKRIKTFKSLHEADNGLAI
ncbi:MAG: hypothetical protein A2030_10325 [Chloroflexi bacterium RBG_19FT_COMBO_50_10]|nr:MAG: hypothetical protein A2030_10325 [Chloroflexi bacterium RBG_19FT_COMBO_50_10]